MNWLSLIIGLLTVILVVDCLLLVLLILVQLPKKEAGLGVAFGSSATDALFGAGSGTALTKITKYCAGIFLGLSLLLSILYAHQSAGSNRSLDAAQMKKSRAASTTPAPAPGPAPVNNLLPAAASTNLLLSATNLAPAAATVTNPAAPEKN